ncbi:SIMPL domain-containing protein [Nocardioides dilutus]
MSRTVTVTGHGSATAVPDTAVVRVAALHRAAGMAEALSGAESARSAVVAAAGEAAGDLVVSSTDLSVWPAHDNEGRRAGFEARHALTITGGDLDTAGALVGRLAEEVGDRLQVESVSLSVGDPSAAVGEAREAAFADARARAEHLAGLAGASLGEVQEIAEGAGAPVPRGGVEAFAVKADVGFAPGQTVLTSTVTVTWALV